MRLLFQLYLDALMKGNPFAVAAALLGATAVSVGPFHEGLSRHDPAAIGLVALILAGLLVVLAVAIIDRRNNRPRPRARDRARSGPR